VVIRLANIYPLVGDFLNEVNERRKLSDVRTRTMPSEAALRSTGTDLGDVLKEDASTRRVWIGLDEETEQFCVKLAGK
jgi:hypothetical protein